MDGMLTVCGKTLLFNTTLSRARQLLAGAGALTSKKAVAYSEILGGGHAQLPLITSVVKRPREAEPPPRGCVGEADA